MICLLDFVLSLFFIFCAVVSGNCCEIDGKGVQRAASVPIQDDVKTFYWFIQSKKSDGKDVSSIPLFIITGSQGVSAVGYHNILSAGPFNEKGEERPESLIEEYHLLFIDAPIGTGFSDPGKNNYFSKNTSEVAKHIEMTIKNFYGENPDFKDCPMYLYTESLATRYIPDTALLLLSDKDPNCKINFRGVFLASPFIEPLHMIQEWGPYLYNRGYFDGSQLNESSKAFNEYFANLNHDSPLDAYSSYLMMEELIKDLSNDVNFCNVLARKDGSNSIIPTSPPATTTSSPSTSIPTSSVPITSVPTSSVPPTSSESVPKPTTGATTPDSYYSSTTEEDIDHDKSGSHLPDNMLFKNLSPIVNKLVLDRTDVIDSINGPEKEELEILKCAKQGDIDDYMNKVVKKKLNCNLKKSLKFGSQDKEVIETLGLDMLSSASDSLVKLLNSNEVKVTIISGMQDLISNTAGTIKWLENLNWNKKDRWLKSSQTDFKASPKYCKFLKGLKCKDRIGFVKKSDNLAYYNLIPAGHYMFREFPGGVKTIINRVLNLKK